MSDPNQIEIEAPEAREHDVEQRIGSLTRDVDRVVASMPQDDVPQELRDAQNELQNANPKNTDTPQKLDTVDRNVRAAEGKQLHEKFGALVGAVAIPAGILSAIQQGGHLDMSLAALGVNTHHDTHITPEKKREREEAKSNGRELNDK